MATVLVVASPILAGCGSTHRATVAPPLLASHPPRPSLSDTFVCAAFNRTVSPTLRGPSYASFAKLAVQAQDVEIRSDAETLVAGSHGNPNFNLAGSKDFHDIGGVCVGMGLTPRYWYELE